MSDEARQPTEDELRAAYEAEVKQIRVEQIVLENIVTLVNMGMRRTGLIPGTEDERDPAQVQIAIEGVRGQLPLVDQIAPEQAKPIQDALAQLQMAFVQIGGAGAQSGAPASSSVTGAASAGSAGASGAGSVPRQPAPSGPATSSGPGAGTGSDPSAPAPGTPGPDAPGADPARPGEPGPAQKSGRLWVPGQ